MLNRRSQLLAALLLPVTALPAAAGSESGSFMVRALATVVIPDSEADIALNGTTVAGADADVSTEVIPATTLTYFFSPNLAVELFCCFAKHDVEGEGTAIEGVELADFWIFPPALTLQYHFTGLGRWKPYVGAGVQYIHFFDEETDIGTGVDIDDGWGFTLQAGIDVPLGGGWYLNADVKKTWLDTDATWYNALGGTVSADVDVDPLIVSAGLGYRFDFGDLFGRRAEVIEPMK